MEVELPKQPGLFTETTGDLFKASRSVVNDYSLQITHAVYHDPYDHVCFWCLGWTNHLPYVSHSIDNARIETLLF
jgi:hypothetical protein